MNRPVRFTGSESATALLSDSRQGRERLGQARVGAEQLLEWVARWVERGGRSLGKPTISESRWEGVLEVMPSYLEGRITAALQRGQVIPACPLALTAARRFDEGRQRSLIRYYLERVRGCAAWPVGSTYHPVRHSRSPARIVSTGAAPGRRTNWNNSRGKSNGALVRVAGVCGTTPQALGEAAFARDVRLPCRPAEHLGFPKTRAKTK